MVRRTLITGILGLLLAVASLCMANEMVVLTETPMAEFSLPDGSVLKNAFVWRRSSEGLMIVHDDGQYFLNFKLLPDDWKAAYLGAPAESVDAPVPVVELDDRNQVNSILEKVPGLTVGGRELMLGPHAPSDAEQTTLALALLQSLVSGNREEATRLFLTIEEKGFNIEAVDAARLFSECSSCSGTGQVERDCPACAGSGKCVKCDGRGERKTSIGNSMIHCTTCRGTGDCPSCKGEAILSSTCRSCRGRGKRMNRDYCEIARDHLTQQINALFHTGQAKARVAVDSVDIKKVFSELTDLKPEARDFYESDAYGGAMDTNILVACVMHSLLKGRMEAAKRFYTMVSVNYPDGDVMNLEDYLKLCETCSGTGTVERDCSGCGGSGKCKRCDGTGERVLDFKDATIHCTTCRGSGLCTECGGDGIWVSRCAVCNARGRVLETQRTRIKLDILVDSLNDYFQADP